MICVSIFKSHNLFQNFSLVRSDRIKQRVFRFLYRQGGGQGTPSIPRLLNFELPLALELPIRWHQTFHQAAGCCVLMIRSHSNPLRTLIPSGKFLHRNFSNPILNDQNKASGDGIGSHIDYGFLTILLQDNVQGLEIKDSDDQWFKAPIIPGTFLINIGHMIQRWTNDYYRATVHRVVSPEDKARLSVPFFFEPNFDTVIEPIERFCTKNNPIKYSTLHFGDYLKKTFKTSYSDIDV